MSKETERPLDFLRDEEGFIEFIENDPLALFGCFLDNSFELDGAKSSHVNEVVLLSQRLSERSYLRANVFLRHQEQRSALVSFLEE